MLGKSHLLVGLTAGVVLDSFVHLSGSPLTMSGSVPLSLVVSKAIFYFMVGVGALTAIVALVSLAVFLKGRRL